MAAVAQGERRVDKAAYFRSIGYEPHPRQWEYHNSTARFRVPVAGRRFGKSIMAARDLEPHLFIPDRRFWIVGPTYDLADKEFRVVWDDLMVKKGLLQHRGVKAAYNKRAGEMYIKFPWNTELYAKSSAHPELLVGESLDGVLMSEAAKQHLDTWERYIRPALADRKGWATFPTTPEGHNWLYNLWRLGQNDDYEDYASWRLPSWDNPYVYPGGRDDPEIKLLEKTVSPEWFLQEIAADFASFVGKIYPEFDETQHVKRVQFRPELPNYIAFDWGFTNPLAAIEFQVDGSDNVYVWREHYLSYTQLDEHIEILRGREQPEGYHVDLAFGDAADPEAAGKVTEKWIACYALPEAKKNWRQGIEVIKRNLRSYPTGEYEITGEPILKPKLFIDYTCSNLIREFQTYRAAVQGRSQIAKELPARQDDHCLDALRYGLMHLFELGVKHHLSDVYSSADFGGKDDGVIFTSGMRF